MARSQIKAHISDVFKLYFLFLFVFFLQRVQFLVENLNARWALTFRKAFFIFINAVVNGPIRPEEILTWTMDNAPSSFFLVAEFSHNPKRFRYLRWQNNQIFGGLESNRVDNLILFNKMKSTAVLVEVDLKYYASGIRANKHWYSLLTRAFSSQ